MNTTNVKIIIRSIRKQKLSNLLSILVLTAGMASFMLIFFYIRYENGFDRKWTNSDHIYRIALNKTLQDGTAMKAAGNYQALGWVLPDEIPAVESSTSLWEDKVMAYTTENFLTDVHFFWGDASFFKVFNCRFLYGDAQNPFPTIQSMVISEAAAKRLFGTENALGKSFKINEGWEFIVSGVFADIPQDSHIKMDLLGTCNQLFYYMGHFDYATSTLRHDPSALSSLPNPSSSWLWTNPDAYTYVKLKSCTSLADVTAGFANIYKKYLTNLLASGIKSEFVMQPISTIHTGPNREHELSVNTDSRTISALWVVAILTLLMSWVIFINFQITQSVERAKEIGLKKVVGANSTSLSVQIVLQSVLINAVGMILAFGIFFLLRKTLSGYLELENLIPVDPISLLVFISVFLFGSILSGLYPALILMTRKAQLLLSRNFVQKNDGFSLRRSLIVFQFAASIGLLIATSVIVKQVSFMKNKDIGLSINQTAYSYIPLSDLKKPGSAEKLKAFMDEVGRMPGFKSATLSSSIPGKAIDMHSNQISPVDNPEKVGSNYGLLTVENHFDEVYEPKMLAGRMFTEDDIRGGTLLVLNREACTQLGFGTPNDAIGKFVNMNVHDYINIDNVKYQVCGVVENFHQESPRKMIEPLLMINDLRWKYDVGYVSVALDQQQAGNTAMAALKEKWEQFYPSDPFGFKFTNQTYQLQLKADNKLAGLFSLYTALSILLASIGLLGLASNATRKRVKEIGIRKVNGATIAEILALLNKDLIIWVVVSFAVATPIAYFAMNKWLESFAYKTTLSWWIFALAGLLALEIALLTVSWQSWRAATRNPVEALRYE
jgi:putative ABC transport system permease protein